MVLRAISVLLATLCIHLLNAHHRSDYASADEHSELSLKENATQILRSNCFACHSGEEPQGDLALDFLNTEFRNDKLAAEQWQLVMDAIRNEVMPPPDERQLAAGDRELLMNWIDSGIRRFVEANGAERLPRRKLTRQEYHNTLRDLLGIEMDFARDHPADPVSPDGFTNDGQLLELTSLHLDAYLDSARRALQRVIVAQTRPEEFHHTFETSNITKWHGETHISSELGRQQQFLAKMEEDYPEQGDFVVRVSVAAELRADRGFPLLEVAVGYRPDTQILFREFPVVEIRAAGEQTIEFRGRIEDFPLPVRGQGKFPGLVVRVRNIYDDGSPLPKKVKAEDKTITYPPEPHLPMLRVRRVEFHGPVFDTWPPSQHTDILPINDRDGGPKRSEVRKVLEHFGQRAFRRPLAKGELRSLLRLYGQIKNDFPTFEDAMRETLAFVLIRPEFLYIPCDDQPRSAGEIESSHGQWSLASRLSYFLWSSMPDERLFDLAKSGLLSQPEILAAEVERMLRSPKSSAFLQQFPDQWLSLDLINNVEISPKYYPSFDAALKTDMVEETRAFFAELVRSNLSAKEFLLADFTMLNEPLARHYGVAGVFGTQFRRVSTSSLPHRGGLLGQAGFMLAGSTGTDSHPVRRAVWIRDRLLNDPPAPPPANVPGLDAIDPSFHQLSMREKLEVHRSDPACARCHHDLDPWGIALENYDAVGLWRDEIRTERGDDWVSSPVSARDTFSNGFVLEGPDILKDYIADEYGDEFARSLLVRMLTYALGRPLELVDQRPVHELTEQFAARGYRMLDLIQLIVSSELFREQSHARDKHDQKVLAP
jgi:hypothetical protein